MESNDSYPVFHTRLARTQRRRLLKPDGSSAGWLIINAADSFATVVNGFATTSEDLVARVRGTGEPAARDADDPPQLAIPHQR